jgi:hypothetical protein
MTTGMALARDFSIQADSAADGAAGDGVHRIHHRFDEAMICCAFSMTNMTTL